MKLKEIIKIVSFPVWINNEDDCIYCETVEDYLQNTNAGMWRKEVTYITTDGNGELTIEI